MPRSVSALRRILSGPIASALSGGSSGSATTAASGSGAGAARALCGVAAARAPHRAGCACGACAGVNAQHRAGCACAACSALASTSRAYSTAPRLGLFAQQQHHRSAAAAQLQAARRYRCCPGLDGAPPDRVVIEYDPEEVDMYIEIADAIEAAYPNIVVDGNVEAEGRPGAFEITGATGTLLFSRLSAGGARPQAAAIVAALEADGAAGGGGGGEGAACSVTASGGGH